MSKSAPCAQCHGKPTHSQPQVPARPGEAQAEDRKRGATSLSLRLAGVGFPHTVSVYRVDHRRNQHHFNSKLFRAPFVY